MSELSLLEQVQAELNALGLTNMRCHADIVGEWWVGESEEAITISNESIRLAFETTWNDNNQQTAAHTPKAMALFARDIEQFADITIISNPELHTIADHMRLWQSYKTSQVLRWEFVFWLNGTIKCGFKSDLMIQLRVSQPTWTTILETFEGMSERIIVAKNLEQQLWKFRNSPPMRFLMGIGSVLIKEEWAIIKDGLTIQGGN